MDQSDLTAQHSLTTTRDYNTRMPTTIRCKTIPDALIFSWTINHANRSCADPDQRFSSYNCGLSCGNALGPASPPLGSINCLPYACEIYKTTVVAKSVGRHNFSTFCICTRPVRPLLSGSARTQQNNSLVSLPHDRVEWPIWRYHLRRSEKLAAGAKKCCVSKSCA